MTMWKVILLFLCFCVSYSAAVISPSSGDLCLGQNETAYTCNFTSSNLLFWSYTGVTDELFSSTSNGTRPLGDYITLEYVPSATGVVSRATVNVSRNINRTTLDCRNSIGGTRQSIVFNVQSSSPATHISAAVTKSNSDISIIVNWGGATCVPMYRISIMRGQDGVFDGTTTNPTFTYSVPGDGYYMFSVSSYNYSGQIIGNPLVSSVCVSTPTFTVGTFPSYDDTLSILIEDTSICQVANTSCSISLTDGSSYNVMMPCAVGRVVEFTGITNGRNYTYNCTRDNVLRSSNQNGAVGTLDVILYTTATVISTSITNETSPAKPGFSHISPLSGIIFGILAILLIVCAILIVVVFYMYHKGNNNKRVNTTNLRTKSPDENVKMSFDEKDVSEM